MLSAKSAQLLLVKLFGMLGSPNTMPWNVVQCLKNLQPHIGSLPIHPCLFKKNSAFFVFLCPDISAIYQACITPGW